MTNVNRVIEIQQFIFKRQSEKSWVTTFILVLKNAEDENDTRTVALMAIAAEAIQNTSHADKRRCMFTAVVCGTTSVPCSQCE